jgi:hypothetical protein
MAAGRKHFLSADSNLRIIRSYILLVPYDAVNRNKVSTCQLPLFYFPSHSLHVSKDYSYYNGSAVRTQLDVRLRVLRPVVPNTCYQT